MATRRSSSRAMARLRSLDERRAPSSRTARAGAPPPSPARVMGGPERRGAVSAAEKKGWSEPKRSGPRSPFLLFAASGARVVFPFRVVYPRATLGYSARSAPFSKASARRKTGAGDVASRGFERGSPPVPANRAPPTPPDPSGAAPCGGSGRDNRNIIRKCQAEGRRRPGRASEGLKPHHPRPESL
jgi:hypothetical protein